MTAGRITIDGQDIAKVTLKSLRRTVGVVQQDSFLFTTSIENNIVYGDPWAKEARIERASESRGSMVLSRSLDVGVMVAFLFYIQRFFDPIRSLTMQYSVMQRAMASGHRISEVLDVPVDVERQAGRGGARRATWTARSSSGT